MRFCFSKYGLNLFLLCATVFFGCATGFDSAIECYSTLQYRKHSLPSFTSYVMNVRSGGNSRVDVYVQMPYRNLRFEKSLDGYRSTLSYAFVIRNIDKEITQTKEIERSVVARTYEESVSSRTDGFMQSFIVIPTEHNIEIIAIDNLSQLRYKESKRIESKKYNDSTVSASTILLLDTVNSDERGLSLRPIFPSSLSRSKNSFGLFQELYNLSEGDTVKIFESYSKSKQQDDNENSFVYFTPPYRVKVIGCNKGNDSVYFTKDSTFIASKKDVQQLIQFYPQPASGFNKIDRTIIVSRASTADTIRLSNKYFIRERSQQSPLSIQEISVAMRYILRESEYDSIAIAMGEDKNRLINQFWSSHGGLDRRKEFEKRIREANILFTECANGAETPMGIIHIICGIPDYIECRGGTVETWYYNIGERSFPIQFRREIESMAYYTMVPFSVNDAVWQYFIDRWRRN